MRRVAIGQFSAGERAADNLEVVRDLAALARGEGASLLVLPEYASFAAPALDERVVEHAEPLDGPFATAVRAMARENDLAVVIGMAERAPGHDRAHNTLLLVGRDGSLVATYRKIHLFDALGFRESAFIEPGDPSDPSARAVMEVDGLRFGAQTCYDIRFPEASRVLVDDGADVLVVAAQWVPGPMKEDQWATLVRARAIENSAYVVAAGQCGPTGAGHSMIVDPMGVVVAGMADEVGVTSAVLDPGRIDEVRRANPVLTARRFHVTAGDP